ncbi:MAG: type 4b pilus protein PilO2, partial [Rickettsiales bacterium]|nr:type 4b pilus protein PilO2 [Rickettsiales bacterium]
SIPDWGYKIAPADWNIEDTKEIAAADLVAKGTPSDLKRIGSNINVKAVAMAGVAAIAGAYFFYSRHQADKAEREAAESRRREFLKKKMEESKAPPPPAPKAWENLVDASDLAKKCTILIVNATATVPGWELVSAACSEKGMTANYKRVYGSASWLFEAQKLGLLSPRIVLRSADANYSRIVGEAEIPLVRRGSFEPKLEKAALQELLTDRFHAFKIHGFKLDNREDFVPDPSAPSDPKAPRGAKKKGVAFPYTYFSFADAAYRLPLDWVKLLNDANSLEFSLIKWDNMSRRWSYEGRVFELVPERRMPADAPAGPAPAPDSAEGAAQGERGME